MKPKTGTRSTQTTFKMFVQKFAKFLTRNDIQLKIKQAVTTIFKSI